MSQEEGPSNPKGKGIDPREWGNINISQESFDLEAQAAAMKSLETQPKEQQREKPHHHKKMQSVSWENRQQPSNAHELSGKWQGKHTEYPTELQPVAQIAPKSYLGTALRNIG